MSAEKQLARIQHDLASFRQWLAEIEREVSMDWAQSEPDTDESFDAIARCELIDRVLAELDRRGFARGE